MQKPILIFGAGKIAEVVYHHIIRDGLFKVAAFCVDQRFLNTQDGTHPKFNLPVVAFDDVERSYPPDKFDMLVVIGYQNLNMLRQQKYAAAKAKGYTLCSYISPRADTGNWLKHGDNCVVLDGVGIQPGTEIGNNVFVWNNSLIGHHSKILDDCWLTAGTTIGGCTEIGEQTFIGLNATIGGEITIGKRNFIGAGALVTKSSVANAVFISSATEKFRLDVDTFLRLTSLPAMNSID